MSIPGTGCADTSVPTVIDGQPATLAQVQFEVKDPTAEDVMFGLDDLDPVSGGELDTAPFTVTVDFEPGAPQSANDTITPATQTVVANGTATGTITVTLRDSEKNPVAGLAVTLAPQGTTGAAADAVAIPDSTSGCASQAPAGTSDCRGQAAFAVSDGTVETVSFLASYAGTVETGSVSGTVGPVSVDFVAGPASPTLSTVSAAPTSALANGTAASTVTVTLRDADGHPAAGRVVTLSQPGSAHSVIASAQIPDTDSGCTTQAPAGTSDCSGQVQFSVTDTAAESVTYTADDATDAVTLTPTATVGFTTTPSVATSTIAADPSSVPADGTTSATVTVTLEDAAGNPVVGKTICLNQASGAVSSAGSCAPGQSTVTPIALTGSGCAPVAPAGVTDCHGQAAFDVTSDVGARRWPTGSPTRPTIPRDRRWGRRPRSPSPRCPPRRGNRAW